MQQVGIVTALSVWQYLSVFHVGDIVRKLRKQRGWDLRDLAREAELSMTTLSELERGVGNQRKDTLERAAKALGTTIEDLYAALSRGKAESSIKADEADVLETDVSDYTPNDIPVIFEGEASPQGTLFWDAEGKLRNEIDRRVSRPRDVTDPRAYGVLVRGDSMVPRYLPGETLIVSPNAVVKTGAFVYVELLSGERLIKQVHRQQDGWILESLNVSYPARFVRKDEVGIMHKIMYGRSL